MDSTIVELNSAISNNWRKYERRKEFSKFVSILVSIFQSYEKNASM